MTDGYKVEREEQEENERKEDLTCSFPSLLTRICALSSRLHHASSDAGVVRTPPDAADAAR
jgi:peroxiredoxin